MVQKLERLGIQTPMDLLFHLPVRYQDRTRVNPIGSLRPGADAVVVGQIQGIDIRRGRRRSLLVQVTDGSGALLLRFFHFNPSQQAGFENNTWIQCYGEVRRGAGLLEMVHPEYRLCATEAAAADTEATLTPIYPGTQGVTTTTMRRLVEQALQRELAALPPLLPEPLAREFNLMELAAALQMMHRPQPDCDIEALENGAHPCQQRLSLEELMAHHLSLSRLREQREQQRSPALPRLPGPTSSWQKLSRTLDFTLTPAQLRVIEEISADLSLAMPTLRLIQGDVGAGKTIVAAAAALQAIDNRYQAALMAPTELLVEQHRRTFLGWLQPLDISVAWLTGKLPAAQRRQTLQQIRDGQHQLIIGTHALFQKQVEFHRLGLVIVDEQHRFGVGQRLALRNKGADGQVPHQIIMSATPIPRSMAMIFYADLDLSSIDQMPPGRLPVVTVALPNNRRSEVATRIRRHCLAGNQVYWVCPLIEESEKLQAQAAVETCEVLRQMLPELCIELIHGRLAARQKDALMQRFHSGEVDLLVATTVIEVGVDVPRASLMVIENAERLGLGQLHQLRGRVGRGAQQAACVLLYQPPLSRLAKERLTVLRSTGDGFQIAEKDLQQRGPGEMLGTRQAGVQQMKIANLHRDAHLLPLVKQLAHRLHRDYPDHIPPLIQRWVSERENYAVV